MLVRIYCPGHFDFMKKLTRQQAIDVAKSYVREFNSEVYIWKPLTGINKGRFRHVCTVTKRDI